MPGLALPSGRMAEIKARTKLLPDHFTKWKFTGILRSSLAHLATGMGTPRNEAQDVLRVRRPGWPSQYRDRRGDSGGRCFA